MRRRYGLVVTCMLTAICSAAAAEELVDNPVYQSWAKFGIGTRVTLAQESNSGGVVRKVESIDELVELTPEAGSIKATIRNPGHDSTAWMHIRPKVKKEELTDPALPPYRGDFKTKPLPDEDVRIGGRNYRCKVIEFAGEVQGRTTTGKSWTCPDIPGQLVRIEIRVTGALVGTGTTTVTSVDVK